MILNFNDPISFINKYKTSMVVMVIAFTISLFIKLPAHSKETTNASTVEDQAPKDTFEYKKMIEAGISQDFNTQSHREGDFAHMLKGLRFVPYQFSRMEEYFPSALIDPAPSTFNLAREIKPSLANTSFKRVDGTTTPTLDEFIHDPSTKLQALLIVHKGKVIFEAYPGMPKKDRHLWMSVSKSTVGILSAMLVTEGKLGLEQPVSYYIPEFKHTAWDNVPVRAALNMTTGLNVGENLVDENTISYRFFMSAFRELNAKGKLEPWVEILKSAEKISEPNTVYEYSSISTQVMTKVVENIIGKPYRTILEERLFHPSGNTTTISMLTMDDGIVQGGAMGISTTLEDLARYAVSYTPSFKRLTGRDGIPQEAINFLYDNKIANQIFAKTNKYRHGQARYGEDYPTSTSASFDFIFEDGAFAKHGFNNQGMYIDPKRDFIGVYFSTTPIGTTENLAAGYFRVISKNL